MKRLKRPVADPADASLEVRPSEERSAAAEYAERLKSGIRYDQTRVLAVEIETLPEKRLVALGADAAAKPFKTLRAQVLARLRQHQWNTLIVTSPSRGCGASLVAVNLAASIALDVNHTVLLVDLDLREPSVAGYFTDEPVPGVADYLVHGEVPQLLFNPGIERLVVMPGSEPLHNSSELLASPGMVELIKEMKGRYESRVLILDMPPILDADDVLVMAPQADAVLLVARDGTTTPEELDKCAEVLGETPIIGTVLNAALD